MIGIATLISTILGALGGSLPKFFELFEKKMNFAQEMKVREFEFKNRMQEHAMQLELAKANISGKIDEQLVEAFRAEVEANAASMLEVIRATSQPTGFTILDFINAAIRPFFFLGIVALYMALIVAYAYADPSTFAQAMVPLFTLGVEGALGWVMGSRAAAKVFVEKRI